MKLKKWQRPPQPLSSADSAFMQYLLKGVRERREAATRPMPRAGATTENVSQATTEAGTGKGEYNERNTSER